MHYFAPEHCHDPLLQNAPKILSFAKNKNRNYLRWQNEVRAKLLELLGETPPLVPLNLRPEYTRDHKEFREHRFVFTSEPNSDVPCHLLIPKRGTPPYPVVICLQGHTNGMHLSLGRPHNQAEKKYLNRRNIGLQAMREGYAALVMEQRCFGERFDQRPAKVRLDVLNTCNHHSMAALLLGRTMIRERAWDVSRAIDTLEKFPEVDTTRVACWGNSGGGTITYFTACLDERIKVAMPSCYVCTFADSIGAIDHCPDNYVPGILKYFEMGDLACLIAPRPLIVVAGQKDPIFPIAAVKRTFALIREIYLAAGAKGNCKLVVGKGGHRIYPELSWSAFRKMSGW
jgi:dienelactone hydrolase